MPKNLPTGRVAARTRFHSILTKMLLIALSVMIVRDIILRRWGSPPPTPDVTRRLP
jgi:hypothetical protein